METPDFTEMPNLENLNMSGCTCLKEVYHSLGCSRKLIKLNLSHCINLVALPSIAQLGALRYLDLSECRRLTQLPELPPELYTLHEDCHVALKSIHNLVTKKKKSQRLTSPNS
uniref:N protein n=1 Tax=Solanum tuberosum TaxID=4113 RepID=M1AKU7_SOLTU